jgi:hypothetical protein
MKDTQKYRVGALADLISSQPSVKTKESKKDLSTLFVSKLPPKPQPQVVSPAKPVKRSASSDPSELSKAKKQKTPG